MARKVRVRTGSGEYRVPAKNAIFILPQHAKNFLKEICATLGKSQQQFIGEAVDDALKRHGMPPLGVRSMRDEIDLDG